MINKIKLYDFFDNVRLSMKLIQLKIFRDIAYTKSFVKSARMNFITQPAVSIHLKQLEEELGVKLFDRVPKKVILTHAGEVYLKHADEILNKCDNLLALAENSQDHTKGIIRIASIHSIGMYELGPFLKAFMRKYRRIQIHLEYQDSFNIYELVQKRKVNIGMVAYPKDHAKIETINYGKDELVLIVAADHHLAHNKKISIQKIINEPFVAFDSNTPTRGKVDKFFKNNNVTVDIKMVNNNIFALKKAVEAGIGISLVPLSTVEDEMQRGDLCVIKLVDAKLYRPLAFLVPKDVEIRTVEKLFMDSLMSYCRSVAN